MDPSERLGARSFRVRLNLSLWLAWAGYWVYGVYASIYVGIPWIDGLVTAALCAVFVALVERGLARRADVVDVPVSGLDLGLAAGFLALTVGVGYRELTDSLVNDQLYHVQAALMHAFRLLAFGLASAPEVAGKLQDVPFKWLLYTANVVFLVAVALPFWLCVKTRSRWLRPVLAVAVFLGWRYLAGTFVTHGDIHPPLRLFLLNVVSIPFGVTDGAFRFVGLLGLAGLFVWMTRRLETILGLVPAVLTGLAVATAPLLWHVSTTAEASQWAALALTAVVLVIETADVQGDGDLPFVGLYTVVALASIVRQSTFIALVPLAFLHLVTRLRQHGLSQRLVVSLVEEAYPVLVMVPWTLFIAYTGTPASDHSGTPFLQRVAPALEGFQALRWAYDHVGAASFALLLVGLLPLPRRAAAFGLALFCCLFALFYSVSPNVWGGARYQAELALPLAAVGLFRLVRWGGRFRVPMFALLVALVVVNAVGFKRIHDVEGEVDNVTFFARSRSGDLRSLSELSFDFQTALREIRAAGLAKGLYLDGTVYGVFPQILAGYSLAEVADDLRAPPVWGGASADQIDSAAFVRTAVFVDWGKKQTQQVREALLMRGWRSFGRFPHPKVKDNVLYVLTR